MDKPTEQNVTTTPAAAPVAATPSQEAVTTQAPTAAKGDDNLMSQLPKKS